MKNIFFCLLMAVMPLVTMAQAKKPSLMVIPSDSWMNEHGYGEATTINGITTFVPDYAKAFVESNELKTAITIINDMMQQEGFPCKDMEAALKGIQEREAENAVKRGGDGERIQVSMLDRIRTRAKPDITIDMSWSIASSGPRKSLTFNLRALDSYTSKQIGACNGTGSPTLSDNVNQMLQQAVKGYMPSFQDGLMTYFSDMFERGREIRMDIKVSGGLSLEDDCGSSSYQDVIEDWVQNNTVRGIYNLSDATETNMVFDDVRIAILDANDRPMDARQWSRGLVNLLKEKGVTVKHYMRGLGEVQIVLSE